jgi:5-oxopent-3-ene-1,2,5-tricarboxylate decarboxylase/2-hydroxyhepta-2,4-diene-1,7-dioate isomerase
MRRGRVARDGAIHSACPDGTALRLDDGRRVAGSGVVWLPPLEPRTVFSIDAPAIGTAGAPVIRLSSRHAFVGHRATLPCPAGAAVRCHVGLVVVIGADARRIPQARAHEVVSGWTIALCCETVGDDAERSDVVGALRDRSIALGPWIVDAADVPDPAALAIRMFVNDREIRRGCARDAACDIPALVEHLSSMLTLSAGDLLVIDVSMVASDLRPGDVVACEIDDIGQLVGTIVDDESN